MQKKSLLALLLALMMLLSGCALVSVDTAKDNARVIVDVNGETVSKAVISAAVQNQISTYEYYNQIYSAYYGISNYYSTDETTITSQVIDAYVNQLVSMQKARELGLYEMTEEEQAAVDASGKESYDSFIQSVISTYMPGSTLEGDELTAAAEKYVAEHDVTTVDGRSVLADFVAAAADDKALEKLEAYIIKDVAVTDEEIQADFDAKVESAKADYEADPNAYGTSVNSGYTVYYAPAGYRMVKHILVKVSDEDSAAATEKQTALTTAQTALTDAQAALDAAAEDADKTALQAAVDEAQKAVDDAQKAYDEAQAAGMAAAKAKADALYTQLTAEGADFEALLADNNGDAAQPANGYAIREGFTSFVEAFANAAMNLQNVGDVTEPVESTYGYHIIKYVADVAEGPVALDTVKDGISSTLLNTKQSEAISAALAQYVSEATVKTYPERMN
ncbi:MAG: peptidylprolyl isomerase [Clostridia bacterium]|nr:peptidylprolyl isomerase [Clostridia bacterium]